jgi:hypothetical protein
VSVAEAGDRTVLASDRDGQAGQYESEDHRRQVHLAAVVVAGDLKPVPVVGPERAEDLEAHLGLPSGVSVCMGKVEAESGRRSETEAKPRHRLRNRR